MIERSRLFIFLGAACLISGAPAHASEAINYDDPNLVFTSEYVGDTATSCPLSPSGKSLHACFAKALGATDADVSDQTEALARATSEPPQ